MELSSEPISQSALSSVYSLHSPGNENGLAAEPAWLYGEKKTFVHLPETKQN